MNGGGYYLGDRLKPLRQRVCVSTREIARMLDVDESMPSRWETPTSTRYSSVPDHFIEPLADVLGVSPAELTAGAERHDKPKDRARPPGAGSPRQRADRLPRTPPVVAYRPGEPLWKVWGVVTDPVAVAAIGCMPAPPEQAESYFAPIGMGSERAPGLYVLVCLLCGRGTGAGGAQGWLRWKPRGVHPPCRWCGGFMWLDELRRFTDVENLHTNVGWRVPMPGAA